MPLASNDVYPDLRKSNSERNLTVIYVLQEVFKKIAFEIKNLSNEDLFNKIVLIYEEMYKYDRSGKEYLTGIETDNEIILLNLEYDQNEEGYIYNKIEYDNSKDVILNKIKNSVFLNSKKPLPRNLDDVKDEFMFIHNLYFIICMNGDFDNEINGRIYGTDMEYLINYFHGIINNKIVTDVVNDKLNIYGVDMVNINNNKNENIINEINRLHIITVKYITDKIEYIPDLNSSLYNNNTVLYEIKNTFKSLKFDPENFSKTKINDYLFLITTNKSEIIENITEIDNMSNDKSEGIRIFYVKDKSEYPHFYPSDNYQKINVMYKNKLSNEMEAYDIISEKYFCGLMEPDNYIKSTIGLLKMKEFNEKRV